MEETSRREYILNSRKVSASVVILERKSEESQVSGLYIAKVVKKFIATCKIKLENHKFQKSVLKVDKFLSSQGVQLENALLDKAARIARFHYDLTASQKAFLNGNDLEALATILTPGRNYYEVTRGSYGSPQDGKYSIEFELY